MEVKYFNPISATKSGTTKIVRMLPRQVVFDHLCIGDTTRDALLEQMIAEATCNQVDLAMLALEEGHDNTVVISCLTDNTLDHVN